MLGLSVYFIECVLPGLIKDLGEVCFCSSNFCGKDRKGCPAGKGPLSPADARPYDIDKPLFREKTKDCVCPRDGLPGCAFVDYVWTVRRRRLEAEALLLHRPVIVCVTDL